MIKNLKNKKMCLSKYVFVGAVSINVVYKWRSEPDKEPLKKTNSLSFVRFGLDDQTVLTKYCCLVIAFEHVIFFDKL